MGKKRGSAATKGAKKTQQKMGRLGGAKRFVQDIRVELGRVNWPDQDQLRQSTAVVLIIVLTLALYVAAWDFAFRNLARLIFT
jgi:preprotein translocase subunit SecE